MNQCQAAKPIEKIFDFETLSGRIRRPNAGTGLGPKSGDRGSWNFDVLWENDKVKVSSLLKTRCVSPSLGHLVEEFEAGAYCSLDSCISRFLFIEIEGLEPLMI
jgi:hypothetical protein